VEEAVIKCLVTGGAGFIGSHLTELLISKGHQVLAVDNLSVGKTKNFANVEKSPNFKFIELDVSDYHALSKAFVDIEWVFHLAALADIVPSIDNPEAYFQANVVGTFNIAKLSKENHIKRLVYAASSSCYGIPKNFPTTEDDQCDPQYPYALTKYLGEQILNHWNTVYKLPVVCLRLFNVYGPRARTSGTYGAVFGVFLAQKLAGSPFTVVGDGSQTRDFTFVSDVCDAFLAAAESEISGEIMNVGSGNTYEVNKLVELLDGPVVYIPKRPGEPDCTFADISKIKTMLPWSPTINLEKGVAIMLDHIDDWRDAPLWDSSGINRATESWFKYLGAKPEAMSND
jgi:UDP-glucose 4-epimerase